jgi:hypothetical protein
MRRSKRRTYTIEEGRRLTHDGGINNWRCFVANERIENVYDDQIDYQLEHLEAEIQSVLADINPMFHPATGAGQRFTAAIRKAIEAIPEMQQLRVAIQQWAAEDEEEEAETEDDETDSDD